jgi:hypothetical protein
MTHTAILDVCVMQTQPFSLYEKVQPARPLTLVFLFPVHSPNRPIRLDGSYDRSLSAGLVHPLCFALLAGLYA